jgi:hypothetical protein
LRSLGANKELNHGRESRQGEGPREGSDRTRGREQHLEREGKRDQMVGAVKDTAHKVKKAVENKIDETLDEIEDDRGSAARTVRRSQ